MLFLVSVHPSLSVFEDSVTTDFFLPHESFSLLFYLAALSSICNVINRNAAYWWGPGHLVDFSVHAISENSAIISADDVRGFQIVGSFRVDLQKILSLDSFIAASPNKLTRISARKSRHVTHRHSLTLKSSPKSIWHVLLETNHHTLLQYRSLNRP